MIEFRKPTAEETKTLAEALRRNASEGTPLHLDPLTTGWIPGADEIRDDEVIDAIRSVPCHYATGKKSKTLRFDGEDLPRGDARKKWLAQVGKIRCGCGSTASYGEHGRDTIGGTAGGFRAVWLGCPNCTGRALGLPLVGDY